MKPVILSGQTHGCPIHGPGTVTNGAANYLFNGKPVARVTYEKFCIALISKGWPGYIIGGKYFARVGDRTG